MVKKLILASALSLSLSCAEQAVPMDPVALLARASLDLRGVRPSPEEIALVEADPTLVDSLIEGYLQDPRFGDRVMSLFADIYRTRVSGFDVRAEDYNLDDELGFRISVGEEPLRLLAHIAQNDLPYGTLTTADFTMANELLGAAWPLDYPEGETGWRPARYTDGRPTAGLLSMNSFWWRYGSTFVNANRGRANAVSRTLLCQDYLSQPIIFERNVNLLDDAATRDAIKNNPGCVACHATLDPLAANFWGFFYDRPDSPLDASFYHAESELFWTFTNRSAPGYFGQPVLSLTDLGEKIAADPRFVECATTQVYEGLLARPATLDDTPVLFEHREVFVDGGTKLRDLFRSVIKSPEYRMDGTADPRFTTKKQVSVDILGSQLEALTGFRFLIDGADALRDLRGFRTLAGGADGRSVTRPAFAPTVTSVIVLERVAEAAAAFAVEHDSQNPEAARLFTEIDFTETLSTDREALVRQLQALYLKIFSKRVPADAKEIELDLALWQELFSVTANTRLAWAGVLSSLLRDPDFIFY